LAAIDKMCRNVAIPYFYFLFEKTFVSLMLITYAQSSLAELEEWRKSKEADTTDWKAMYEELLNRHEQYKDIHNEMLAKFK